MLGQKFPQIEFRQSENIKIDLWQTARDSQNTETIREKKFRVLVYTNLFRVSEQRKDFKDIQKRTFWISLRKNSSLIKGSVVPLLCATTTPKHTHKQTTSEKEKASSHVVQSSRLGIPDRRRWRCAFERANTIFVGEEDIQKRLYEIRFRGRPCVCGPHHR